MLGHDHSSGLFVAEARITGLLEHANIVPVHGLGRTPEGKPHLAMKLVRGTSWRELIHGALSREGREGVSSSRAGAAGRALELKDHVRILLAVCNALAYAHERGVIHRDVKPDNVVIGTHGEAVLLDWGIARVRGIATAPAETTVRDGVAAAAEQATVHGTVVGTLAYMAPEQAHGELDSLDERADVFALGAMLYHVLTGRPPYAGGSAVELLAEARACMPRPTRELAPRAPASLVAIAERAMARQPAQRFASAQELAQVLERFQAQAALGRERTAIGVFAYVLPSLIMLAALLGIPASLRMVPSLREQGLGVVFVLVACAASLLASVTDLFTRGRHVLSPLAFGFALATFLGGVAQSFSGVSAVLGTLADSQLASDAVRYREVLTVGMYEALGALWTGSVFGAIAFIAWGVAARRAALARRADRT
jgi:hypothetical protein